MIHEIDSFPGREIVHDGKKYLYFGGTSYLGLQNDSKFKEIYINNIKKYGTNYGASRKSNVRLTIFEKVENYLADVVGSESCLTLSSGYLAGQLISNYFHSQGHPCFYAPETHEAVHQLQSKNHKSIGHLIRDLKKAVKTDTKSPVLFLDAIDLNGKNYPDFEWLNALPLHDIILVIDDSHGLGIVGEHGGGVFRSLKSSKCKELIVCGSLGKGFGIQAGVVAGNSQLINDLKSTHLFAAASPASPASLATLMESSEIHLKKWETLKKNIAYFIKKVNCLAALTYIDDYPAFLVKDKELPLHLLTHNIIITDFNYPTEDENAIQRIVLSAQHTKQDIETLARALNLFFTSTV